MFAAVTRDALLGLAHLPTQVACFLIQKLGGGIDQPVLRGVLVLDVDVHRVVHRRRGLQWVVRDERDFDHVGEANRRGVQPVLDGQQRPVAGRILHGPIDRIIRRLIGFQAEQGRARRAGSG